MTIDNKKCFSFVTRILKSENCPLSTIWLATVARSFKYENLEKQLCLYMSKTK